MILHLKEGRWVVARTLVGSPADSAGIRVGYALHSIAGNEIAHSLRHTKLKGTSNNDDFVVGSPAAVA
jgi:S1-C subfamily serine protease